MRGSCLVVISLLIALLGNGCLSKEGACNKVALFAPVSVSVKGVDIDVRVKNSGVPHEYEIEGTVSCESGVCIVWQHASLIPLESDQKNGLYGESARHKSFGGATRPPILKDKDTFIIRVKENLSDIRCINLRIDMRLRSGEEFRCSVKLYNKEAAATIV